MALLDGDHLCVAHAGDSRVVLSCGGKAIRLTQDHKPDNTEETDRIEYAGGRCVCVCVCVCVKERERERAS